MIFSKPRGLSTPILVLFCYGLMLWLLLYFFPMADREEAMMLTKISQYHLIRHYGIVFFSFLASFIGVEWIFRAIQFRTKNSRCYVGWQAACLTVWVAMAIYAHIFMMAHYAADFSHKARLMAFLRHQAPILIAISFVLAFLLYLVVFSFTAMGSKTLWNMVFNHYQCPQTEKQIIMFLDLNDSTPITAKLGNRVYLRLLQQVFAEVSHAVYLASASIHDYTGDAAVILWSYETGKKNNQCLYLFHDIEQGLAKKREYYLRTYGLMPTFKASVHCGELVLGVMGLHEKQVKYCGAALNVGARILAKCHALGHPLLISETLRQELKLGTGIQLSPCGPQSLKGVAKPLPLYGVNFSDAESPPP